MAKNGRNSARLPSQNGFALGRPLETWNDRPRDLEPIVREFKNEDVTEMASMRLDEMLRSPLPACGGPHRAKKLLLYLVAASVGLAGTPYVHWCFGVSKPV